jgi:hypothetical protein
MVAAAEWRSLMQFIAQIHSADKRCSIHLLDRIKNQAEKTQLPSARYEKWFVLN